MRNRKRGFNFGACLLCLGAVNVAHAQDAKTLKEVTVTAESDADVQRYESVAQKVILDQAEIQSLGGLTISEVIRKLPGIDAGQHSADGAPAANARGMGRDAVQFLVDGERPSANARYALTTVGRMPSGELERIEIVRGASAEFGNAAPVTVNLVMRKAKAQAGSSLKASLGMRGDEPNGQFSFSQSGGSRNDTGEQFSWVFPISINHHGMPSERTVTREAFSTGTRNRWQEEAESSPYSLDELVLSPRLSWRDGGDSLTLWPSYYHNQGKRSGRFSRDAYANPALGTGLAADGGRQEVEVSQMHIARVRLEGDKRLSDGKLSGRLAVMQGQRNSDTDRVWTDSVAVQTRSRESLHRDENEILSALRWDRSLKGSTDQLVSLGIEQTMHDRQDRQRVQGSGAFNGNYRGSSQQWSLWGQHEWTVGPVLSLTSGLRGEFVQLDSSGRAKQYQQLAPSVAARFQLRPDVLFRTSLGAGIKAPKLDEISGLTLRTASVNSPLEADRGGNPALQAERNINLEAALEKHLAGEAGVLGANVYIRRTSDFIERRVALENTRWVDRPSNEGTARHWGLELDAKLRSDPYGYKGGSLRTHLTLPKAMVDDQRLGIQRVARDLPEFQWTLGYDQSFPALKSTAGFQMIQYGKVRTEIPSELNSQQNPRTLLDVYWVRALDKQLNLRFEVQNIARADTHRMLDARAGNDEWLLRSRERGQRTFLVSLEGKW